MWWWLLGCAPGDGVVPAPRRDAVAAVADDTLWVVGGRTAAGLSAETWLLRLGSKAWERGPDAPMAMARGVMAWDGAALLVYAGEGEAGPSGALYRLDPRTLAWAELAPLGAPRAAPAGAWFDGALHLFGGLDEEGVADGAVWRWSGQGWALRSQEPLLEGWHHHAATDTEAGTVAVMGGVVEEGEPAVVLWTGEGAARVDVGLVGLVRPCTLGDDGTVWVWGGSVDAATAWAWSAGWSEGPEGPAPRVGAACATVADSLYVYGGDLAGDEASPALTDDAWRLSDGAWYRVLAEGGRPP